MSFSFCFTFRSWPGLVKVEEYPRPSNRLGVRRISGRMKKNDNCARYKAKEQACICINWAFRKLRPPQSLSPHICSNLPMMERVSVQGKAEKKATTENITGLPYI
ncbi:hypothetical protein HCDG_07901 [Histoplasma capsulatum H143]|uniref:Uncharacterized protein n=1 Tax=Ajellomyces capsulatus (strain H143) TaxID=544712 RepID=C6HNX0_AJECH|nr:hypothetical protein HCDG_07901 [Histoplasma capsulatum H143]